MPFILPPLSKTAAMKSKAHTKSKRTKQLERMGLTLPPLAKQRHSEDVLAIKRKAAVMATSSLAPIQEEVIPHVDDLDEPAAKRPCVVVVPPIPIKPQPQVPQPQPAKHQRLVHCLWQHSNDLLLDGALQAVRTCREQVQAGTYTMATIRHRMASSQTVLHQATMLALCVANQDGGSACATHAEMQPIHYTAREFDAAAAIAILCTWRAVCHPFASCMHLKLEATILLGPASFRGYSCLGSLTHGDMDRARKVISRWVNMKQLDLETLRQGFLKSIMIYTEEEAKADLLQSTMYRMLNTASLDPAASAKQRARAQWYPIPLEVALYAWKNAHMDNINGWPDMAVYNGYMCVHNLPENYRFIMCIAMGLLERMLDHITKIDAVTISKNHASAVNTTYQLTLPQARLPRLGEKQTKRNKNSALESMDTYDIPMIRAVTAAGVSMSWLGMFFRGTDVVDIMLCEDFDCLHPFEPRHRQHLEHGSGAATTATGTALAMRRSIMSGHSSGGGFGMQTSQTRLRASTLQLIQSVMAILTGKTSESKPRHVEVAHAFATCTGIAPCVASVVVRACMCADSNLPAMHQFKYHVRWFLMEQLRCAGWTLVHAKTLIAFLLKTSKGPGYADADDYTWLWNRTQFLDGSACKTVWSGDKAIAGVCPLERQNKDARVSVLLLRLKELPGRDNVFGVADIEDMLGNYEQAYDQHADDIRARFAPLITDEDVGRRTRWNMCKDCLHACCAADGDTHAKLVRPVAWTRTSDDASENKPIIKP